MEKQNNFAHEVRTMDVKFTSFNRQTPRIIEELIVKIHNCRDCDNCFKWNEFYECSVDHLDHRTLGNIRASETRFKYHRITRCENFTPKK